VIHRIGEVRLLCQHWPGIHNRFRIDQATSDRVPSSDPALFQKKLKRRQPAFSGDYIILTVLCWNYDEALYLRARLDAGGESLNRPVVHFAPTAWATNKDRSDGPYYRGVNNLTAKIGKAQTVGSVRLISMRHEFPTEWAKFKNTAIAPGTVAPLSFSLLPQHFPFWATKLGLKLGSTNGVSSGLSGVQFFAETTNPVNLYDGANTATAKTNALTSNSAWGLMTGSLLKVPLPPVVDSANLPATPYTLYCDNNGMTDLWMAVTWPK
jgi:hypothetical protein